MGNAHPPVKSLRWNPPGQLKLKSVSKTLKAFAGLCSYKL